MSRSISYGDIRGGGGPQLRKQSHDLAHGSGFRSPGTRLRPISHGERGRSNLLQRHLPERKPHTRRPGRVSHTPKGWATGRCNAYVHPSQQLPIASAWRRANSRSCRRCLILMRRVIGTRMFRLTGRADAQRAPRVWLQPGVLAKRIEPADPPCGRSSCVCKD